MIRKRKGGYFVVSEGGKNLGGPYPTKAAAEKRLAQVEMFKHMKPKKSKTSTKSKKGTKTKKGTKAKAPKKGTKLKIPRK